MRAERRARESLQARLPLSLALLGFAALAPACIGAIGDDPPSSSGGGGSPSTCAPVVGSLDAQRLTRLEYNNVIRDLFGLTADFSANFSEPATGPAGFTTESTAQNLSSEIVLDFYHGANAVVQAAFARSPNPLLTCTDGDACATQIITDLASRAFRRPATQDEIDRLFNLYKSSTNPKFSEAMKLVVTAILLAPQFIFRTADLPTSGDAKVPLDSYQLASRLSFFIWGSIPDSELLAAANDGSILKPEVLKLETTRMLKDPKASYLANAFGAQWLELRRFDAQVLDKTRFPQWNDGMKASMKNETLAFVTNVLTNEGSVLDFVSAKYTFVDQNVSGIYGMSGTYDSLTQVTTDDSRVGLLTQPAILALTSTAEVTAPVRRGKWVLDEMLCSAPPPPPANVPKLPPDPSGELAGESNIRARLDQHRQQGSTCFGCHSVMDPVGLSFEHFDSMGFYRDQYQDGTPVDASGQLPTGENLTGVSDLATVLANDSRFPVCFASKLTSFAQGRDATKAEDHCSVQALAADNIDAGKPSSDVILAIVSSEGFLNRTVKN